MEINMDLNKSKNHIYLNQIIITFAGCLFLSKKGCNIVNILLNVDFSSYNFNLCVNFFDI